MGASLTSDATLPPDVVTPRFSHPFGPMLWRNSWVFGTTLRDLLGLAASTLASTRSSLESWATGELDGTINLLQTGATRRILPAAYPADLNAWYCPGAFDVASGTWHDCSGNGNTATLSGSGLAEWRGAGHGATNEVHALTGTTSSVISFGAVIQSAFTVCSVTRYTGGTKTPDPARRRQELAARPLVGPRRGGVLRRVEDGAQQDNVSPDTDWVVMCGTNAESQLKLVNGADVGSAAGGSGDVSLFVNAGDKAVQKSDFAIVEVVVWPRGLTAEEMRGASEYLIDRMGLLPAAYPADLNAWYCPGAFDVASGTWADCSGNGNTATLSGSGLAEWRGAGHGATNDVHALTGTTSSVISFGAVIQSAFTVCSVTRYTGGAKTRILQGGGKNWLHGHWSGRAGVAYYEGWKTAKQDNVSPDTDWVVMCGTNAESRLKLVNGADVGSATGGSGGVSLFVNAGNKGVQKSDFAIVEVVVWPRGLTAEEMRGASNHLIDRMGLRPAAYPADLNAWYCPGAFDVASNKWADCSGNGNTATLSGSGLAEWRGAGHGATNDVHALTGTTSSAISFGAVIQSEFTVCSVTRYTGGAKGRILQGGGKNWLHGHCPEGAGMAFYQGRPRLVEQDSVSPDTDWVVMCGTNAESQLMLVNGADVGSAAGGSGDVSLFVNAGARGDWAKSDFAIAEVVVWPRGLTAEEMRGASNHLINSLHFRPAAYPADLNAWYCPGAFDVASNKWADCSGNGNTATLSGSGLAEWRGAGHGATNDVHALTGTTSSAISFGAVIQSEFTVCSVTRYTGGAKGRILQGGGKNWLHGHLAGGAGMAFYQGWNTPSMEQDSVSPDTDWVVMCGTNAESQLMLVNGADVGSATGGIGDVSLFVNAGAVGDGRSRTSRSPRWSCGRVA